MPTAASTCGPRASSTTSSVVAEEALSGLVLSGSIQWLDPGERERLVDLASTRLALEGVLVRAVGDAASLGPRTPITC